MTKVRSASDTGQDQADSEEEGVIFPGKHKVRFSEEDGQEEGHARGMK